jgi:hypothetical protein
MSAEEMPGQYGVIRHIAHKDTHIQGPIFIQNREVNGPAGFVGGPLASDIECGKTGKMC